MGNIVNVFKINFPASTLLSLLEDVLQYYYARFPMRSFRVTCKGKCYGIKHVYGQSRMSEVDLKLHKTYFGLVAVQESFCKDLKLFHSDTVSVS